MFMLRQTSVKMAVLLHKQASDRFHSLLTVGLLFGGHPDGIRVKLLEVIKKYYMRLACYAASSLGHHSPGSAH